LCRQILQETESSPRQKSHGRIDGMVALTEAYGVMPEIHPEASIYESRGILFV
jgi:hypothetical protein